MIDMTPDKVRELIADRADWVYSGPRASVAHVMMFGTRSSGGDGGTPLCGRYNRYEWLGTGSQDERDRAKQLHLCDSCVAAALYRNLLHP